MLFDSFCDQVPINEGTFPVARIRAEGGGNFPLDIFRVIDAALDGRKSAIFFCQFDTGLHGKIADIFHDLSRELE